jgi:hypothetical protein
MPPVHYSPKFSARPCWHCTAIGGMAAQGTAALSSHRECVCVRSGPETGRVCWEREVGADNEPWHPDYSGSTPWTPADATRQRMMRPQLVAWAP